MNRDTLPADPNQRLAVLVQAHEAKLRAVARSARTPAGFGVVLTAIDEPANQMMTLPMSVQDARQALKHFQDEYIQNMFELFALMTPLAPWTAIIVAQLYTAEDKTYSGVAVLDMFAEWNQAQEKQRARWVN